MKGRKWYIEAMVSETGRRSRGEEMERAMPSAIGDSR